MRYTFIGKDSVLTDPVKKRIEDKLDKIGKFLPEDPSAIVRLTEIPSRKLYKLEVTIPIRKRVLRAEVIEENKDFAIFSSIDKVVDILESQVVKYKSRLRSIQRKEPSLKEEYNSIVIDDSSAVDTKQQDKPIIERTKKFAIKPMDIEEAVMELELIGHNFFVYLNSNTNEVNVVYKRNDSSYGLIEPEF